MLQEYINLGWGKICLTKALELFCGETKNYNIMSNNVFYTIYLFTPRRGTVWNLLVYVKLLASVLKDLDQSQV